MTLATMADRSLSLAERVAAALAAAARGIRSDEIASISDLVADIAAADRLARADDAFVSAHDEYWAGEGLTSLWLAVEAAEEQRDAARLAYRAGRGGRAGEVTDG